MRFRSIQLAVGAIRCLAGIEQTGSQLSINVPDLDQGLPLDIEHSEPLTNQRLRWFVVTVLTQLELYPLMHYKSCRESEGEGVPVSI